MPVTMSSIIPDSGSSRKAQGIWNDPIPLAVASGMGGIQDPSVTTCSRASDGSPSISQNA